jgi:hypothetical protein
MLTNIENFGIDNIGDTYVFHILSGANFFDYFGKKFKKLNYSVYENCYFIFPFIYTDPPYISCYCHSSEKYLIYDTFYPIEIRAILTKKVLFEKISFNKNKYRFRIKEKQLSWKTN